MRDAYKRLIFYSCVFIAVALVYYTQFYDRLSWKDYTSKLDSYYYTIYTDLPQEDLKLYADIYQSMRAVFERKFLSVGTKKVRIYVFASPASYEKYRKKLGSFAPDTDYGFYKPARSIIAINSGSGLGTYTHELSHHFIKSSGIEIPLWLDEGFSAFFEKFIGLRKNDGQLIMTFGYFSPGRLRETWELKTAGRLSLKALFGEKEPNESVASCFVLFVFDRGRLKQLLDNTVITKDGVKLAEETFRQPFGDVESEWVSWMEEAGTRPEIPWIQESRIYTENELKEAMNDYYPPLKFSPEKERFLYDWSGGNDFKEQLKKAWSEAKNPIFDKY